MYGPEFVRFQDAEVVLARTFADYNNDRIHSALWNVTPNEFARKVEYGNKRGLKSFGKNAKNGTKTRDPDQINTSCMRFCC